VQLLAHHLALRTESRTMTLLIDGQNYKSLALAERLDFRPAQSRPSQPAGQRFFVRAVPPRRYRDGAVTIRPLNCDALEGVGEGFGRGPKWRFAGDIDGARHVVSVDCDLAHHDVPAGEAHISCSAHVAPGGRGYLSRAVRLALTFLRDNTAAREAHILVDERNPTSRYATADLGAREHERFVNEFGHTMVRHVMYIR
jgi:RimJ/RimL family protein N-acetyltransferase